MEPTFAMRWFYSSIENEQVAAGRKTCAVCGLPTMLSTPRKKVLRATFTNYDLLRKRSGNDVCPACEWYFNHQEFRRTGWWLRARGADRMKKAQWLALLRAHIEQGAPEDAYYLIRPLGLAGKHQTLWAQMTIAGNCRLNVQWGTMPMVIGAQFLELTIAAHRLRDHHSWKEIRSGNYYAKHILAWSDRGEFIKLRVKVQPWVNTAQLSLAEFLWSKPKEVT